MAYYYRTSASMTERQADYLHNLLRINNRYRAKALNLHDLLNADPNEDVPIYRATYMIDSLIRENDLCKSEEQRLKALWHKAPPRSTLFASDFIRYTFCETSFAHALLNTPNLNFYELKRGIFLHNQLERDFGTERTVYHPPQNVFDSFFQSLFGYKLVPLKTSLKRHMQKQFPETLDIISMQNDQEVLYKKELNLSGLPDFLSVKNNQLLSIIEIKTSNNPSPSTDIGEELQLFSYTRLLDPSNRSILKDHTLDSTHYIAHICDNQISQISEINFSPKHDHLFSQYLKDMNQIIKHISPQSRYSPKRPLPSPGRPTLNKCNSCGHRHFCPYRASP